MIYECVRTNDVTEYCESQVNSNQLLIPNPPDGYMLANGGIVSCPIFGEWSEKEALVDDAYCFNSYGINTFQVDNKVTY